MRRGFAYGALDAEGVLDVEGAKARTRSRGEAGVLSTGERDGSGVRARRRFVRRRMEGASDVVFARIAFVRTVRGMMLRTAP